MTNAFLAWFPYITNCILSGINAGLIGGFITFSTYLNEATQLKFTSSIIYLLITAILGLIGVEIGLTL